MRIRIKLYPVDYLKKNNAPNDIVRYAESIKGRDTDADSCDGDIIVPFENDLLKIESRYCEYIRIHGIRKDEHSA